MQASCLRLLLAAPAALLDAPTLVQPLQAALRLGLSYPPLASAALDGSAGMVTCTLTPVAAMG
jgi:hypothetical protein